MTQPAIYPIPRGSTLQLILRVKSGTVTGDEALRAQGKKMDRLSAGLPASSVPVAFTMTGVFAAASGNEPDRWYLGLTDEQTAALDPGYYAVDANIQLAGGAAVQSHPAIVQILDRVTVPA